MDSLLIVDDDVALGDMLKQYLEAEGFVVSVAMTGAKALEAIRTTQFGAVVLDVMLPGVNGLDVLREIRSSSRVPILMLSARGADIDRIVGLEIGADDYIAKPCQPRELAARIRAVLRRANSKEAKYGTLDEGPVRLRIDDLELRGGERLVICKERPVNLTATEFNILELLLLNAGHPVDKSTLAEKGLGGARSPINRSVDIHVSHIRRKLGLTAAGSERIKTIHGKGYMYVRKTTHAITQS